MSQEMVSAENQRQTLANDGSGGGDSLARRSGIMLMAGSTIMIVFMAMHPTGHGHDLVEFIADIAQGAVFNGVVHGTLMAVGCVVLLGLIGFAERIGLKLLLVRAGLIAYIVGNLAGIGAALVNGFILPGLAIKNPSATAEAADKLRPLLAICTESNQALARLDVFATSAAVLLWSWALSRRLGLARPIVITGLLCGMIPLLTLIAGRLPMNVHGFGGFILLQTIWNFTVGFHLIRGKV